MKELFNFKDDINYKYLGIVFSSSGLFNQDKEELYKKALKTVFKLQRCLSISSPSISTMINLIDHMVKPILTYSSEIWGMFKTNSAACRKENDYFFEKIYINEHTNKSHIKYTIYGLTKRLLI